MALATVITLNIGDPAADVVFGDPVKVGKKSVRTAPSPNNDLAGKRPLTVSHETTSSNVVRSLVRFDFPEQDSNGKVVGTISAYAVIARRRVSTLSNVKTAVEALGEFLSDSGRQDDIVNEEI